MTADINGHSLYYIEQGNRSGLPIIFVHGFPFDHTMWDKQLTGLSANYRLISYDVRGHGKSQSQDKNFSIEGFAKDLVSFVEFLKVDKCVLCGLSMGGYIVMNAIPLLKNKLAGIILCDTKAEGDTEEGKEKRKATIRKIEMEGLQKFSEGFIDGVLAPENKTDKMIRLMIQKMITGNSQENIIQTIKALAERKDITGIIKQLNVPALIIVGENDEITPVAAAQAMNKSIQNSKLKIIKGAGHMSNLENTEAFNSEMEKFLVSLK